MIPISRLFLGLCLAGFILISGTGRYGYSFVRITALLLSSDRLWVGTGNGVILSIPLVAARPSRASSSSGGASNESSPTHAIAVHNQYTGFMPYCSMVSNVICGPFYELWHDFNCRLVLNIYRRIPC